MQKAFAEMQTAMQDFIQQPDFSCLMLNVTDNEVVFPTKVLQNNERASDSEIYLLFPFDCESVDQYLLSAMELLSAQIDSVNSQRIKEGKTPWSPLPLKCLDPRIPLNERLRHSIDHVRGLIQDSEIPIVWGLLPATITDVDGYKALIAELLALNGHEAWMDGHRFIVRDNKQTPFALPELMETKAETLLILDIDFSPERACNQLAANVNDPKLPLKDRMDALFQTAALDFAHQRYDLALDKYALLHDYSLQTSNPILQAQCLGGAGDVCAQKGDWVVAKQRYQQALAVIIPEKNLVIMHLMLANAGRASMQLKEYEDAEGYYELAQKAAGKLMNPFAKSDALEQMGLACVYQKKIDRAMVSWKTAYSLSEEHSYTERSNSVKKLIDQYQRYEQQAVDPERTVMASLPKHLKTKAEKVDK